jgi:hypothetical protein
MSFDTDFDFTNDVVKYTNIKNSFQTYLDSTNEDLNLINSCVGYDDIKNKELSRLNANQSSYAEMINGYNTTLTQISTLQALNQNDKTTLHTFWGFTECSNERYMCLIIYNYTSMLLDTDILDLVKDNVNTVELKKYIGKILILKYTEGRFC